MLERGIVGNYLDKEAPGRGSFVEVNVVLM